MFNYYFDSDRDGHQATIALFEAIGLGSYEGYTSGYTVAELQNAPEQKKNDMMGLLDKYGIVVLDGNEEVFRLADVYIQNDVIPKNKQLDALHIAIASINELNYILSFNFKHINKQKTKRMVEYFNLNEGYRNIIICQPEEIIENEN
jgi:hypothetical protein